MANANHETDQTIIATDDARGALGPEEQSPGDTMLPTLVIGSILAIIALGVIWWLI